MFASRFDSLQNSPNLANEIRLTEGRRPPSATRSHTFFTALLRTIALWRRRSKERAILARFTNQDMHDLGITRIDVMREVRKPFWRA